MRIYIWSFGRVSAMRAYADLFEEYRRRMPATLPVSLELLPSPKARASEAEQRQLETEILLKKMQNFVAHYVVLDERGQKWHSSQNFADYLHDLRIRHAKVVFLVGGAFGLGAAILQAKHPIYSLSNLTLPRYLVILTLAEQLYRASTILHQKPYHH